MKLIAPSVEYRIEDGISAMCDFILMSPDMYDENLDPDGQIEKLLPDIIWRFAKIQSELTDLMEELRHFDIVAKGNNEELVICTHKNGDDDETN